MKNQFVKLDNSIINVNIIKSIDLTELNNQYICVTLNDNTTHIVSGFFALELIWQIKPSALEGNNFIKWKRHVWNIHNLFGHPLMQILAWFKSYTLAIWIHDVTIPKPIKFK